MEKGNAKGNDKDNTKYLLVGISSAIVLSVISYMELSEAATSKIETVQSSPLNLAQKLLNESPPTSEEITKRINDNRYGALGIVDRLVKDDEIYKNELPRNYKEFYEKLGYSEHAALILSKRDPKSTITIKDHLNKSEQKEMLEELRFMKTHGHRPGSIQELNSIVSATKDIYDFGSNHDYIDFEPSKMPDKLNYEYSYIGSHINPMIRERVELSGGEYKSPYLTRVFQSPDGSIITVTEENIEEGYSIKVKEFVTNWIGDYPVVIQKIRNEQTKQEVWVSDFSNGKYAYQIHYVGNSDNVDVKNELLAITEGFLNSN